MGASGVGSRHDRSRCTAESLATIGRGYEGCDSNEEHSIVSSYRYPDNLQPFVEHC